ncbi:dinuclear metal center YbgI/SA1388 family protein [Vagococcus fluvialis]|uniref:GTP cyclohydrolase 1 type 2 homolog n=2 Tax=Vagococcus fluvialis TaxID=2738 RepID=A0A369B2N9_9ENTE|nr:Nif3-like dinuclear metal center hexameric protein [Vagococcus fluvialis]MBO0479642.1 Nif3-like dinuclear metal center hexameric protein [Vagococcus fluvialis]MBO0485396.1 Nif3-like dinuclear metal center hexameric protein [Vagococcus fluvialis]RCX15713.1 dinuclear metal center YbgI/SA1388 family protein [Vagococcus fluvialis]RSU04400.1 Nif3-like dinuclear metal center hexameric protein [Vagococcus fluvialis]
MSITGYEFIQRLESYCPLYLAEKGDPVGLHIGTLNKPVKNIMMTLDVRPAVVKEAIEKKVDLIIAKHPPIFRPIKRLTTDDFQTQMYADLIKNDIAVYAAHTNMDIVSPGLNDWFLEKLDIIPDDFVTKTHSFNYKKLVVFTPRSHSGLIREQMAKIGVGQIGPDYSDCSYTSSGTGRFKPINGATPYIGEKDNIEVVEEDRIEFLFSELIEKEVIQSLIKVHPYEEPAFDIFTVENLKDEYGLGRVGDLKEPMSLMDFTKKVKTVFHLDGLRLITDTKDKEVKRIAICGGSGEKFYKDALKKKADVYITGDVYYHTAHDMIEEKLSVIDPGHYIEELCKEKFVELFNTWKKENNWDVSFMISETNTNPFEFI